MQEAGIEHKGKLVKRTILVFASILFSCSSSQRTGKNEDLTLAMQDCEEENTKYYREISRASLESATRWFEKYGYGVDRRKVLSGVEVFCTRESAKKRLAEVFGIGEDEIPDNFSGTVQESTLYLVSKEIYQENYSRLYGSEHWNEDEYLKLSTHELVHRCHALIATNIFGTEDGMGPTWLFEGLAIYATGQFDVTEDELNKVTVEEFRNFLDGFHKKALQKPIYTKYSKYFRYVLRKKDVKWIIDSAGKENVEEEILKSLDRASSERRLGGAAGLE